LRFFDADHGQSLPYSLQKSDLAELVVCAGSFRLLQTCRFVDRVFGPSRLDRAAGAVISGIFAL
jgi:hypothetical protein